MKECIEALDILALCRRPPCPASTEYVGADEPQNIRRRLDKKEPGLKTLKRIAYLAKDMVHRFYFGKTPLVVKPEWMDDDEWEERMATTSWWPYY